MMATSKMKTTSKNEDDLKNKDDLKKKTIIFFLSVLSWLRQRSDYCSRAAIFYNILYNTDWLMEDEGLQTICFFWKIRSAQSF